VRGNARRCRWLQRLRDEGGNPVPQFPIFKRCAYCGSTAQARELMQCTGCLKALYCGAQCQAAAWPRHANACRLPTTPQNRHEAMRTPFIGAAPTRTIRFSQPELERCHYCLRISPDLMQCTGCLTALYCDVHCQTAAWPAHSPVCGQPATVQYPAAGLKAGAAPMVTATAGASYDVYMGTDALQPRTAQNMRPASDVAEPVAYKYPLIVGPLATAHGVRAHSLNLAHDWRRHPCCSFHLLARCRLNLNSHPMQGPATLMHARVPFETRSRIRSMRCSQ
jgi:hypothetical protein